MSKDNIGYLYINGLIKNKIKFVDSLVHWWWARAGIDIQLAKADWFDDKTINDRIDLLSDTLQNMLKTYDGVVLIGSSAGGSLALNLFDRFKDKNVCAVLAHSRLKVGNYANDQHLSLYHSARIGRQVNAKSFFDSVHLVEEKTIPRLTIPEKNRILCMTQLTDNVVPISTMTIDGVKSRKFFAFGHRGGFLAHIIIGRNIIIRYAKKWLQ